MRLLTLNIRFGAGSASPEKPGYDLPIDAGKLAALADAIRAMQPDVAALQEVYNATQAQRLADVLRMRVVYARHPSSYSLDFFEWGLAFLHDSETIRTHLHSIDFDMDRRAGRNALIATLAVDGNPVTFLNVHLAPGHTNRQIAAMLSLTDTIEEPLVIMGDFNCRPDDPAMEPIRSRWTDTCQAVTHDAAREAEAVGTVLHKQERIDYVFVDPRHFIVEAVGLAPAAHRLISDHLGYFADVRLKGRERPIRSL